jgi:hypothetical protein
MDGFFPGMLKLFFFSFFCFRFSIVTFDGKPSDHGDNGLHFAAGMHIIGVCVFVVSFLPSFFFFLFGV